MRGNRFPLPRSNPRAQLKTNAEFNRFLNGETISAIKASRVMTYEQAVEIVLNAAQQAAGALHDSESRAEIEEAITIVAQDLADLERHSR